MVYGIRSCCIQPSKYVWHQLSDHIYRISSYLIGWTNLEERHFSVILKWMSVYHYVTNLEFMTKVKDTMDRCIEYSKTTISKKAFDKKLRDASLTSSSVSDLFRNMIAFDWMKNHEPGLLYDTEVETSD